MISCAIALWAQRLPLLPSPQKMPMTGLQSLLCLFQCFHLSLHSKSSLLSVYLQISCETRASTKLWNSKHAVTCRPATQAGLSTIPRDRDLFMTHMPVVISIGVMDTYSSACVRLVWSIPHTHNAKWKAKDMPETSMSRPFCSASTCNAIQRFL